MAWIFFIVIFSFAGSVSQLRLWLTSLLLDDFLPLEKSGVKTQHPTPLSPSSFFRRAGKKWGGGGRASNSVSASPPPPSESTLWNHRFVLASHVFVGFFVFVTFFFQWSNRNLLLLAISYLVGKKCYCPRRWETAASLSPHALPDISLPPPTSYFVSSWTQRNF